MADSGGKEIKRNGEPGNPGYVLAMDKGDSKDGKEVAKKGSNLHSREDQSTEGESGGGAEEDKSGKSGGGGKKAAGSGKKGSGSGEFVTDEVEEVAPAPGTEDVEDLDEEVMAEDEAAGGGKEDEEALEAQLEAEDKAAEDGGAEGAADEEGVLKRKPLDAPTTRGEESKVAKMDGALPRLSACAGHAGGSVSLLSGDCC